MNYAMLAAVLAYKIIVIVGLRTWLRRRRDAAAKNEFALAGYLKYRSRTPD